MSHVERGEDLLPEVVERLLAARILPKTLSHYWLSEEGNESLGPYRTRHG